MNIQDFTRIVTSFADRPTDLELRKGELITEIRGELIQAKIIFKNNVLFVQEGGNEESAVLWIRNRIANLPQLADRILDYIPSDQSFVTPSGRLLDDLEYDPSEQEQTIPDTTEKLVEILGRRIPGTSNIVYLTSDAGEGKTTMINQLALKQARYFKEKKSDWLLLPIPLGGRPFLRFDDIVIASIVNNLRFRYFYYDAFLELVRLGFLVPAFDGFEEMFMQSSTGEALSATGGLINKLESSGSILIAARKAYFDYKSFNSQAKLFDSINSSVSFAKMAIDRWDKSHFNQYTIKKGIFDSEEIYSIISQRLGSESHPILTRPVLVKQLIEVFKDIDSLNNFVSKLESVNSYFPEFVDAIIEREANLKWIDTSGEPFKPILTIEQHYELLSLLAEEMWINSSELMRDSVLDLIAELFSEQNKFNVQTTRQIKERIKQHALIVREDSSYRFDHEEFFEFFLGVCIADNLMYNKANVVKTILRKAPLPLQTSDSTISRVKKGPNDYSDIKSTFDIILKGEGQFSYVKENVGKLLIRLLSNLENGIVSVESYEFPINSFLTIDIMNVEFTECHFQTTLLQNSKISNCHFKNCRFDRLEVGESTKFHNVTLEDCEVSVVYDIDRDKGFYDKFSINAFIASKGISVKHKTEIPKGKDHYDTIDDEDLELTEKALRRFIRQNTPINDNIFKIRLGNKADHFLKNILPSLIRHGIIVELDFVGQGQKRRFKLGASFSRIDAALSESNGSYENFLSFFSEDDR